ADALVVEQIRNVAETVEESGDGRSRVAGHEVNAALGFECALHQQFVSCENFSTGIGEEAGIGSHVSQSIFLRGPFDKLRAAWLTAQAGFRREGSGRRRR